MTRARRITSVLVSLAALIGFGLITAPAASASTPTSCSSVRQIGTTKVLQVGGQDSVSVKQYYGCGYNYAYIYVWQSYRDTHTNWDIYVAIMKPGDSTFYGPAGLTSTTRSELWGSAADTSSSCTYADGGINGVYGDTSTVC